MRVHASSEASSRTSSAPDAAHKMESTPEWLALLEFAARRPNRDVLATLLRGSLNWSELLQLAEYHGFICLLAERAKTVDASSIPPASQVSLQERQRTFTVSSLHLIAELFRVLKAFAESRIDVLLTKGPALSVRCYGHPNMRQYGDIDLIVRERDIRRLTQTMVNLGYQPRIPLTAIHAQKGTGEYAFRKAGTDALVEFHTERTLRHHPSRLPIETVFARSTSITIDGRDVPVLSLEDELVLICVHGAKHFWERLMWIADVAALMWSLNPPDWNRAMAAAREVHAERIVRLGLRLASDLLGAKLSPQIESSVRADRTVAKLAAQIKASLASPSSPPMGVLHRAMFRVRMRGGLFAGPAYLLRLSLAPTEEDWTPEEAHQRSVVMEVIGRPLRLLKKHGRRSSS